MSMELSQNFARRIKALRKRFNLTLPELSKRSGLKELLLVKLENQETSDQDITFSILKKLANT